LQAQSQRAEFLQGPVPAIETIRAAMQLVAAFVGRQVMLLAVQAESRTPMRLA
jgi:hypothetical protein